MNLELWKKVYKRNVELDDIFFQKYENESKMYEKNCVEFMVEFGEFLNETKCFKYWSIKGPKLDELLEEFADVFTMLLYFYNESNSELSVINVDKNDDLYYLINEVYYLGTRLQRTVTKELLDNIFSKLLSIANILKIEEIEIIEAINKKHIIIEERLNSEY